MISEEDIKSNTPKERSTQTTRFECFLFYVMLLCRKKLDEFLDGSMYSFGVLATSCGEVRLAATTTLHQLSSLANVLADVHTCCDGTIRSSRREQRFAASNGTNHYDTVLHLCPKLEGNIFNELRTKWCDSLQDLRWWPH